MMKRILNLTFIASALLIASCKPDNPENTAKLDVSVTAGEAAVTELTFTVTSKNATNCAWMCVEDGAAVPSGIDIMQKGKQVFANTEASATAANLKDNTTYVIIAAAMDGDANIVTSDLVRMTTLERPAQPAVTLSNESTAGSTFTFKVSPVDAQKCAYKLYAKGADATADDVLSTGTEVSATEAETVTLEDLEDGEYFVVAAVQNGETKVLSSKLSFLINTATPTYTINPTRVYRSYSGNSGKDQIIRFNFVDMKGETSNIALNFVLAASSDYVPAGTYELGGTDAPAPKLDSSYTAQVITNGTNGAFESGTCEVVIKDGHYTFMINLLRADDESFNAGEMLTFTWTGDVEDMPIV